MKTMLVAALTLASACAFADPGVYEGKGTFTIGGKDTAYSMVLDVKEQPGGTVTFASDAKWVGEKDEAEHYHFVVELRVNADRSVQVVDAGKVVGSGYYYKLGDDKWLDVNYQFQGTPTHFNAYYHAATKQVYRMGDTQWNGQKMTWVETLSKQK